MGILLTAILTSIIPITVACVESTTPKDFDIKKKDTNLEDLKPKSSTSCINCNNKISDDQNYCSRCGQKIEK